MTLYTQGSRVDATFGQPRMPTSGGTASTLTLDDAVKFGITSSQDTGKAWTARPYIGQMHDDRGLNKLPTTIYAGGTDLVGHIATFAPTRAGKGSCQIIPVGLSWQFNLLMLDIKGEGYLNTAGYRHTKLGQRIQRFSPFEDETHRFNPIMAIAIDDPMRAEEDALYIARLACPSAQGGSSEGRFFDQWSVRILAALLLHVRTAKLESQVTLATQLQSKDKFDRASAKAAVQERSMAEIVRMANIDADARHALLERMKLSSFPIVRQTATSLQDLVGGNDTRTGDNIMSALQAHLDCWSLQRVKRATYVPGDGGEPGPNEVEFGDLRNRGIDGEPRTTIYVVIPPDELSNWQPVLRVMIGLAVRTLRMSQDRSVGQPPILAILDEFPQLGYMAPIEESLLYMAGYGLIFWFFFQSVSDLERIYPASYRTFLANVLTQCFFGVSDHDTAEYLSELAGTHTVINEAFSKGVGGSDSQSTAEAEGSSTSPGGGGTSHTATTTTTSGTSWNVTESTSYISRRLFNSDEVRTMPRDLALVFIRHTNPIVARLIRYKLIGGLAPNAKIPPPQPIRWDSGD